MKTVHWSLLVGCSISLFCLAQVNEVASQEATSPGSSTVTNSLGSGGLANTSGVTTTADIIATTNALAAKTTTTTTTTITPIPAVQYLTPSEWAAVTNGINPGDLAELANLTNQTGTLSAAAQAALNAGLTTSDVAAIAATAAQVLAAQAQSAGSVQPMNSSSGSMLISGPILNINFGGQSNAEIGPAAVGCSSTDYWNAGYIPSYVYCTAFSNLLWSSGQPLGINVAVRGAQGDWGNGTTYDAMFSSYIYVPNGAITVTLTGVPQGTYDLYFYGHGPTTDYSVFFVTSPSNNLGIQYTSMTTNWQSSTWALGAQEQGGFEL